MTDIVERLAEASATKQYASLEFGCVACGVDANLLAEAADEIERLRAEYNQVREELDFECQENEALLAENAMLRMALHYYASPDEAGAVARNALKRDVAPPTDHNAPGQADANPSQCPRPESE